MDRYICDNKNSQTFMVGPRKHLDPGDNGAYCKIISDFLYVGSTSELDAGSKRLPQLLRENGFQRNKSRSGQIVEDAITVGNKR